MSTSLTQNVFTFDLYSFDEDGVAIFCTPNQVIPQFIDTVAFTLHIHIFILYTVFYEDKENYRPSTGGSGCAHPTPTFGT